MLGRSCVKRIDLLRAVLSPPTPGKMEHRHKTEQMSQTKHLNKSILQANPVREWTERCVVTVGS